VPPVEEALNKEATVRDSRVGSCQVGRREIVAWWGYRIGLENPKTVFVDVHSYLGSVLVSWITWTRKLFEYSHRVLLPLRKRSTACSTVSCTVQQLCCRPMISAYHPALSAAWVVRASCPGACRVLCLTLSQFLRGLPRFFLSNP